MRLIDADALKEAISNHPLIDFTDDDIFELIDNAPTVEERPQGEWYYNYQNGWHCSICHETVKDMPTVKGKADYNFCPRCGADMRGAE